MVLDRTGQDVVAVDEEGKGHFLDCLCSQEEERMHSSMTWESISIFWHLQVVPTVLNFASIR
jgi:hypothetical protein